MHYGPLDDDVRIGPGFGPPPVRKRRRRRGPAIAVVAGVVAVLVIVGLAVTLVLVLNSQGTATPGASASAQPAVAATPAKRSMLGTMSMPRFAKPHTAYDSPNWKVTSVGCEGLGGYSDIGPGTSVTVYDGSGKIVGVSALTFGERHGQTCEWSFGVLDLPDVPFYQVEVGHRGKVPVQKADLGTVAVSLGD